MNLLDRILADKRLEVAARRKAEPPAAIRARAERAPEGASFLHALRSRPVGLIAEVKRRSPSAGAIRTPFDPAAIARAYAAGGAQALSVLMDAKYFGGGEEDFRAVRAAVSLPILYKEFVVDAWQIHHARAIGASAVLLIAGALPLATLRRYVALCAEVGLEPLVEVHDEAELRDALRTKAVCIGVNNRNLKTFKTTLETTFELARKVPGDRLLVSESGIATASDVVAVARAGARAVLVGEHLLRKRNLARAARNLMGRAWASS